MADSDLAAGDTLNKKIRNGQLSQYNYILGVWVGVGGGVHNVGACIVCVHFQLRHFSLQWLGKWSRETIQLVFVLATMLITERRHVMP